MKPPGGGLSIQARRTGMRLPRDWKKMSMRCKFILLAAYILLQRKGP